MNMCDTLFNEMIKNHENLDDMKFFLDLHYGFDEYYRKMCVEFHNRVLISGLNKEITAYNQENNGRNLILRPLKKANDCLKKTQDSEISLRVDNYWPEQVCVQFGSDVFNLGSIYIQLYVEEPKLLSPSATASLKAEFENYPFVTNVYSNEHGAWFYYAGCFRDLRWREAAEALIFDVAKYRNDNNEAGQGPLAGRYISDIMTVVRFVDKMVAEQQELCR